MKINCDMILFDLDDTLLTSRKTISDRTRAAIVKAGSRGMPIGYVTARSPSRIDEILRGLPCDALAMYSGALIRVGDEVIHSVDMPFLHGLEIIRCIEGEYPDYRINAHFQPYCYKDGRIYHLQEGTNFPSFEETAKKDFQRIIIYSTEIGRITQHVTDDMVMTPAGHGREIIISHRDANKAAAAGRIASRMNIKPERIVAFGDDIGDMDMLGFCGIGVAMGNSMEELKKKADYLTEDNDNDGIAIWMEKYIL